MTPKDVFQIPDSIVTREIVGETLLVPVSGDLADMDNIFALNGTAAFIWALFNGENRLERIRDEVCETFEVDAGQAWQDLQELLKELSEAGLVVQVG